MDISVINTLSMRVAKFHQKTVLSDKYLAEQVVACQPPTFFITQFFEGHLAIPRKSMVTIIRVQKVVFSSKIEGFVHLRELDSNSWHV